MSRQPSAGSVNELLGIMRRHHKQAGKLKWSTDVLGTNEFATGYEKGWHDAVNVAVRYWRGKMKERTA